MKIKLAIIDNDENYVKRLVNNLQLHYADRLEVYSFSGISRFLSFYEENHVHVALVNEALSISEELPENLAFAWLVSSNDIKTCQGRPAVGKFQRSELLYKEVLGLYADLENQLVLKSGSKGKCIVFTSAQGGAGTSTLAAAYAAYAARTGKRPLYLNLDLLSNPSLYFQADGNTGFSELLYALKAKKGNLAIKLESLVKKDSRGVQYFDVSKNANDMLELKPEDAELLMETVHAMESVDCVIVDLPMNFDLLCSTMLEKYANVVVWVNDGTEVGNGKLMRCVEILSHQPKLKADISSKMKIVYNRFGRGCEKRNDFGMEVVGEIGCLEAASPSRVMERLADNGVMSRIV